MKLVKYTNYPIADTYIPIKSFELQPILNQLSEFDLESIKNGGFAVVTYHVKCNEFTSGYSCKTNVKLANSIPTRIQAANLIE